MFCTYFTSAAELYQVGIFCDFLKYDVILRNPNKNLEHLKSEKNDARAIILQICI